MFQEALLSRPHLLKAMPSQVALSHPRSPRFPQPQIHSDPKIQSLFLARKGLAP